MPSRTQLACIAFAVASALAVPLAVCAQTSSTPLRGEVRKRDGASRLPRPGLPMESASPSTNEHPIDSATFEIKPPAKGAPEVSPFDPWPSSTTNVLKHKPLIPESIPHKQPLPKPSPELGSAISPNADALEIISKYDIYLLLDQSGSMSTPDCLGMTRWQWCEQETRNFATTTGPVLKGIDLTLFSQFYRDLGVLNADKLHDVFVHNAPSGGTNLFMPLLHLSERMAYGYQHGYGRPVIIAVITDGEPEDGYQVGKLVVQLTDQVPKGLIKIVFLKVGESTVGDEFIRELDDSMYGKGAKYDLVDGKSFDYLRAHGLLRTLVDSVKE